MALVAGATVALGGSGGPARAANLRPPTRTAALTAASAAPIVAIGAENEYANVLAQIGGPYVDVSSILNNPNTDPHTFESSPSVAEEVSKAAADRPERRGLRRLHEQDRVGLAELARKVITVQNLLGLPDDTPNPHLWYKPTTMPAVAEAMAADLGALEPAHAAVLRGPGQGLRRRRSTRGSTPSPPSRPSTPASAVATTEPVADYLLQAMGIDNLTPWPFQADIMNGVDPSPQDISPQDGFFTKHQVQGVRATTSRWSTR